MVTSENELMSNMHVCENCEWCVQQLNSEFPHCLLLNQQRGLLQSCDNFKKRTTGNHISM